MHEMLPIRQCMRFKPLHQLARSYSAHTTKHRLIPENAVIPPYPFGPAQWYKQSNFGLYGGQRIQFGNNVSERTKIKTRRSWSPNVQRKQLYSAILGRHIRVRITTRVLRTIDKVGGLDEYLLGDKPARIKELGPRGWMLRWRLMQEPIVQKRFAEARRGLGWLGSETEGESVGVFGTPDVGTTEAVKRFDSQLDEEEQRLEKLERKRALKETAADEEKSFNQEFRLEDAGDRKRLEDPLLLAPEKGVFPRQGDGSDQRRLAKHR